MSASNRFGSIVTGRDVERAMIAHLQRWMRTYLRELERVTDRAAGTIADPASYLTASTVDKWPEAQTPAVLIIAPGTLANPVRMGDSSYEVTWGVGVVPLVSSTDEVKTRDLALDYTAAIRAAVLQHKSLGGFATNVEWREESYDDVPFEATRFTGAGHVAFGVTVADVTTEAAGPAEPLPTPETDPGPWPDATIVDTTVVSKPITESVSA